MNYQKIHDAIISRSRSRIYDSRIHQKHHIIPRHEDPLSEETTPLTFKEHYIVHLLRFKMGCGVGNLKAYLFIRGLPSDIWDICSHAGEVGGKMTKSLEKGIFDPTWDRSPIGKENWRKYILPFIRTYGRLGGLSTKSKGLGIFDPELQYKRTEWAKIGARALKRSGNFGGVASKEWREQHKDEMREYNSFGGKGGGLITGRMLWWNNGLINRKSNTCPGKGWTRGMIMSEKKRDQVYRNFAGHNRRK